MKQKEYVRLTQARTVSIAGLSSTGHKGLASKFTDQQGRLLADPPASADQYLNPDVIVVAHIDGADETPGASWADWEEHLSRHIGKKVVDQVYTNSADQIAAAASGKVTLLALHAADTPFLVNNYGFQPIAVLGDDAGVAGNRMDLIVPADSSINKPADLVGHRLTCTAPSSITGYRAAIVTLMQDDGLRPNVDYELTWSLKQKLSIEGVAHKQYQAAAVSDEKLQATEEKGTIEASQYRIIYQTPVIQRTTIGYFYNLNPKLAEQLRTAILASTGPTSQPTTGPTAASEVLRFLPTDYKKDFEFVRNMDDQFDPRFDSKKTTSASD
jgi:phosphonate transport system substrate-binding protein